MSTLTVTQQNTRKRSTKKKAVDIAGTEDEGEGSVGGESDTGVDEGKEDTKIKGKKEVEKFVMELDDRARHAQDAVISYNSIDIVAHEKQFVFGKYVHRDVDQRGVDTLRQQFMRVILPGLLDCMFIFELEPLQFKPECINIDLKKALTCPIKFTETAPVIQVLAGSIA